MPQPLFNMNLSGSPIARQLVGEGTSKRRLRHHGKTQCKADAVQAHHQVYSGGLSFRIVQASSPSELRALGYLRAACFYEYPAERSQFARRSHCRMKADQEWRSLEGKLQGTEVGWKQTSVVPLLALAASTVDSKLISAVLSGMTDLSAQVPADKAGGSPLVPVGSVDLNIGVSLPAEELVGRLPKEDAMLSRGYLSNVCVAEGVRRKGIARELMLRSLTVAEEMGVVHVYVHVVESNASAIALYEACGFQIEAEEDADVARKRQHGRRLLFGKPLPAK